MLHVVLGTVEIYSCYRNPRKSNGRVSFLIGTSQIAVSTYAELNMLIVRLTSRKIAKI